MNWLQVGVSGSGIGTARFEEEGESGKGIGVFRRIVQRGVKGKGNGTMFCGLMLPGQVDDAAELGEPLLENPGAASGPQSRTIPYNTQ